ncbi:MAG: Sec-independent protein translocase protein TatC [Hyphomicrobiaceae bacterium hypho_1]
MTEARHVENERADIDASKAPLMEHLLELRKRLVYSVAAFFVAFAFCFIFAGTIFNVLLFPFISIVGSDNAKIIYTHLLEKFFTEVKVGLFGATFLSFPYFAIQIYKFVAPGLYSNERKAFRPYLFATPLLFLTGACVVYFVAMPLLVKFSVGFQQMGGDGIAAIQLLPKVSEYLSLIMTLILGFGICFQLPVIITLLAHAGIVTSEMLRKKRRWAVVGVFVAAAILTPPDPISQIAMALPTLALYELSIFAVMNLEKITLKRSGMQSTAGSSDL